MAVTRRQYQRFMLGSCCIMLMYHDEITLAATLKWFADFAVCKYDFKKRTHSHQCVYTCQTIWLTLQR